MSAAKSKKRKRRSQAPVALVYFVTMIIFMALLAMLSVYLLKEFKIIGVQEEEEPVVSAQNFTDLYARINSKNVLSDMTIIRMDTEAQTITVIPISAMTVNKKNTANTMRDVYEQEGMQGVKLAVEGTYGISIDNYATLNNSTFERVADIFGGMTYTAQEDLYYLSQDNDENDISIAKGENVTLSGRQIRLLTQYPVFAAGKEGNNKFLGEAVSSVINSAFQQVNITTDNLDNIYKIVTSNSDTNITNDDYKLHKAYIKDMLSNGKMPASYICPEGTWSGDERFVTSDGFIDSIRGRFADAVPETETDIETNTENAAE